MKKLLVICEPRFDFISKSTVNLAMNEILFEYLNYFEQVHCLCPGEYNAVNIDGARGVVFHTVDGYIGSKIRKGLYQFGTPSLNIESILIDNNIDIIQFRIPSTFSMAFYKKLRHFKIVKTCYIAGDIYESYVNNFGHLPFIKIMARWMSYNQKEIISKSLAVSTGDVLREKYSNINCDIHAFYSTTHKEVLRENIDLREDFISIIYVGRIDLAKRLEDLVEAANILIIEGKNLHVNIIGSGPALKNILELVKNLDIEQFFSFHGYINDRNVIDSMLLKSDVLVLPSLTEGTAKVLPEAMSRGVIPIAVNGVGSNNFIINKEINGFLVGPKNPNEISQKISLLYNNENLYKKMKSEVYLYAESRTVSKEIGKLWKFIFDKVK